MNTIFRFRPPNDLTLKELMENYLWFSRPLGFNDEKDGNIIAFAKENESIKEAFNRVFGNYREFGDKMRLSGICCFTELLPKKNDWGHFPNSSGGGIFIEYDTAELQNYFLCRYGTPFHEIDYVTDPTTLRISKDGYDILWEIDEEGIGQWKSIKSIEADARAMNELIRRLLTRLDIKHQKQRESRLLLVRNIPSKSPDLKGYEMPIPADLIVKIHVHPKTPNSFMEQLKSIVPCNQLNFDIQ